MKIRIHENTGKVYIATESPKDLYALGRISAKMPNDGVYSSNDGTDNKELTLSLKDLINELSK